MKLFLEKVAVNPEQIKALIESHLPDSSVSVSTPDNTHYEATVVSEDFTGKRPLQRHQLIYAALGSLMGNEIHALSIQAFTPGEWARRGEPAQ